MNKGALRGLGLPGSLIEQVPQLWVGGNPITSPAQPTATGDLVAGSPLNSLGGTNVPPVYGLYSGRPPSPGWADYFEFVDDYRYIEQNGPASSGTIADNCATHRAFLLPTFNSAVSDYSLTAYAVSGFVGGTAIWGGSGFTGLAASGRVGGFGTHLDVSVPVYGLYAFQAHIGLLGTTGVMATEMVAFDINELNSFGSTATNVFGFRLASSVGMVGSTNWGLMIGQPSNGSANAAVNQVRGPITLGGAADLTVPAAQVDIQNVTALPTAGAPGTAIESLTDTPASGSAFIRKTYRSKVTTTSATAATLWTSAATPSGGRWLYTGILMCRQTGGSGGTTGQGCAWTFSFSVTDGVADQGSFNGGATLVGTKPTGWLPTYTASTAGAVIQAVGATNENITWWIEVQAYGPLAT